MENIWQLQEAKNKFSNFVEKAQHNGPQIVTKRGKLQGSKYFMKINDTTYKNRGTLTKGGKKLSSIKKFYCPLRMFVIG